MTALTDDDPGSVRAATPTAPVTPAEHLAVRLTDALDRVLSWVEEHGSVEWPGYDDLVNEVRGLWLEEAEPLGDHQVYEARLQLQDHQQQLDADGVMVGVSREALDVLLRHFSEAWNELHCCDDVALSEGLVGGIADLCAQRDYWRALVPPVARHIFAPTEFGGDTCAICGGDLRDERHERAA